MKRFLAGHEDSPRLIAETQQAGDAHAFVTSLPADPLGLIAGQVDAGAGALCGAIAQANVAFTAQRTAENVVLGVVVEACFDTERIRRRWASR